MRNQINDFVSHFRYFREAFVVDAENGSNIRWQTLKEQHP